MRGVPVGGGRGGRRSGKDGQLTVKSIRREAGQLAEAGLRNMLYNRRKIPSLIEILKFGSRAVIQKHRQLRPAA